MIIVCVCVYVYVCVCVITLKLLYKVFCKEKEGKAKITLLSLIAYDWLTSYGSSHHNFVRSFNSEIILKLVASVV